MNKYEQQIHALVPEIAQYGATLEVPRDEKVNDLINRIIDHNAQNIDTLIMVCGGAYAIADDTDNNKIKIIIARHMLRHMTKYQARAIILHELGHIVNKHIEKRLAVIVGQSTEVIDELQQEREANAFAVTHKTNRLVLAGAVIKLTVLGNMRMMKRLNGSVEFVPKWGPDGRGVLEYSAPTIKERVRELMCF